MIIGVATLVAVAQEPDAKSRFNQILKDFGFSSSSANNRDVSQGEDGLLSTNESTSISKTDQS